MEEEEENDDPFLVEQSGNREALYTPLCLLCGQIVHQDRPTEYRVITHASNSSEIEALEPYWNESTFDDWSLEHPDSDRGFLLFTATVEVAGYKANQQYLLPTDHRLVETIYLVHTRCKEVIQTALPIFRSKIPLITLINAIIPSLAPRETQESPISDLDVLAYSIHLNGDPRNQRKETLNTRQDSRVSWLETPSSSISRRGDLEHHQTVVSNVQDDASASSVDLRGVPTPLDRILTRHQRNITRATHELLLRHLARLFNPWGPAIERVLARPQSLSNENNLQNPKETIFSNQSVQTLQPHLADCPVPSLENMLQRLPEELVDLTLGFLPQDQALYLACVRFRNARAVLHILRKNQSRNHLCRALHVAKMLCHNENLTNGEEEDSTDTISLGRYMRARFIRLDGIDYLCDLSSASLEPGQMRFYPETSSYTSCHFLLDRPRYLILKVAPLGIIDIAFTVVDGNRPLWLLDAAFEDYRLSYQYSTSAISIIRASSDVSICQTALLTSNIFKGPEV